LLELGEVGDLVDVGAIDTGVVHLATLTRSPDAREI
jgi:hypothetical protein